MRKRNPFAKTDKLKAAWDKAQPIQADRRERLWQKLRLEWNYNSNHLEGNTLTYGETFLLLVHGRTSGSHDLREFEEMKAHDVAVDFVNELASETKRTLTEADVRDLNRLLLKEPYYKPAITVDGKSTRKRIVPGVYKSVPNNVLTATGEVFYFTDPTDTPPAMTALMEWLNGELKSSSRHPIETAAMLHWRFVSIHPFDDGNGRTARLIMNYVLLRGGYPPIVIKSADKPAYLDALREADAGNIAAFVAYLETAMEWSLELALKAAKGKSIEEPEDVDKEIAVFVSRQKEGLQTVVSRSPEVAKLLWKETLLPLAKTFAKRVEANFKQLFETVEIRLANESLNESRSVYSMRIFHVALSGYRGAECEPFDVRWGLLVKLNQYDYTFYNTTNRYVYERDRTFFKSTYSRFTADVERELTSLMMKDIWDHIRSHLPSEPSKKKTAAKLAKHGASKRAGR